MIDRAIEAFWAAWPAVRPMLEAELSAGEYGSGTERLTELTEAIQPELEWELMPGQTAEHALCMSSAADPRLRMITQQWMDAAPAAGSTWEYHPARIAIGLEPIELDGLLIDPAEAAVGIEPDRAGETLDIVIGHPDFAGIDEALQLQAAFRFLDDLLGEDDAEQWIGSVDVIPDRLGWGIPLAELAGSVELVATSATGDQWEAIDQFDAELGESELVINRALKRHAHLDLVMLITLSVEVPSRTSVTHADLVEEELAELLGTAGLIFARETYDTFVVVYAYARLEVAGALAGLRERHAPALYDVVAEPDPGWDAYDEMR